MAKRKNVRRSVQETKAVEEERLREQIAMEADLAAELMEDERYPFLKDLCARNAKAVALALARVLNKGTKIVKKGGVEVLLDPTSQLIESRLLSFKLEFLNTFPHEPQEAINLQTRLEARDEEMQAALDAQEEEINE